MGEELEKGIRAHPRHASVPQVSKPKAIRILFHKFGKSSLKPIG